MTQQKAIFLAEVLEAELRSAAHHDAAAAELRRLHDIEKAYASACELIDEQDKKLVEIERQRDALLEAMVAAHDQLIGLQPVIANGLLTKQQLAFIDPHIDAVMETLVAAIKAAEQTP